MPDAPVEEAAFEAIIEPWLRLPGVTTAVLASSDGLLVAATGSQGREIEALAANCAAVLAAANGLDAGSAPAGPRLVAIETADGGIILAPLGKELFLIIAGRTGILRLAGSSGRYGLPVHGF